MRNMLSVVIAVALLASVVLFSSRSFESHITPDGKATVIERTYWDGHVKSDTIPMGPLTSATNSGRLSGAFDPFALAALAMTSLCAIGVYGLWAAWKSG